ncbi:hypothetical protein SDC9_173398 [bioreactor metagenome]|uniref:Uncharacterized protein n=1 Tax=bioreactor metagenome TaxID=1076179 RepID=A0A645GIE1_9ZZZZ
MVEFQCLFQGENVRKKRHLNHTGKADSFEGAAQHTRRDIGGILADEGGRNHGVDRAFGVFNGVEHGQDVSAFRELSRLTAVDAGGASDAQVLVNNHFPRFILA